MGEYVQTWHRVLLPSEPKLSSQIRSLLDIAIDYETKPTYNDTGRVLSFGTRDDYGDANDTWDFLDHLGLSYISSNEGWGDGGEVTWHRGSESDRSRSDGANGHVTYTAEQIRAAIIQGGVEGVLVLISMREPPLELLREYPVAWEMIIAEKVQQECEVPKE